MDHENRAFVGRPVVWVVNSEDGVDVSILCFDLVVLDFVACCPEHLWHALEVVVGRHISAYVVELHQDQRQHCKKKVRSLIFQHFKFYHFS